jgi:hypothetical protein
LRRKARRRGFRRRGSTRESSNTRQAPAWGELQGGPAERLFERHERPTVQVHGDSAVALHSRVQRSPSRRNDAAVRRSRDGAAVRRRRACIQRMCLEISRFNRSAGDHQGSFDVAPALRPGARLSCIRFVTDQCYMPNA